MNKAVAEERTRYNDMKSRMQERIQQIYQEGVARKQEAVAKRPCVGVELLPRIY